MGNSQTKEARQQGTASSARVGVESSSTGAPTSRTERIPDQLSDRPPLASYASTGRRGSRPDLSFLGIGSNSERDVSSLEVRRETKQEREARKLEKERAARLKERERSMKEEHIDGGYLVTQGVYVGTEDYNKAIVRQLMIERRLAPFWRGLNEFSESWAEHQLMAAARGMPIPPADEVPPELEFQGKSDPSINLQPSDQNSKSLTVPSSARSLSYTSSASSYPTPSFAQQGSPQGSPPTSAPIFRTRAKTLASLTTSSKSNPQADMTPRELHLPRDPTVNGQSIEVFLYKDASECPICFLYYPPYLNTTRCCDQPICSECFVQIKRPDPHPPEHEQPDTNAPPASEGDRDLESEGQLVSEVATCPFCKQPEFGITYAPPPFRRGLTYSAGSQPLGASSATSSQTSLSSTGLSPSSSRRRATSLSATAPGVITTDKIRPDWASKLATARAHAARRSAAATALHTAAYLMGGSGQPDPRVFAPFGRRNVLRRQNFDANGNSAHLDALAILAERHNAREQEQGPQSDGSFNPFLPPPRGSSSRRSRMDELEDMMMMEAIRLSLAAEDDRRRKEEKEAKKEAKKKEKDTKKAEKAARKAGLHAINLNASHAGTDSGPSSPLACVESASSSFIEEEPITCGKGKGVDRTGTPPLGITHRNLQDFSSSSAPTGQQDLSLQFNALASEPSKRSHLRQMSNASSSASSLMDPGSSQAMTGSNTPPGGGAGTEPMFNFRSLAAMIGDNEKGEDGVHVEITTRPHADSDQSGSTQASSVPSDVRSHPKHETSEAGDVQSS
ncbi:hypothetical protein EPUS_03633 [Endocarpon pusillum Z07020]|uniref:Protein SIP5 n=1 Tax=Endocarpon pusillum (strain Z07020 / HMAS-L-300199) TaxID=1263415 RepID=U1GD82_ENDPU|nr:uncharacterized protein EPUS_03633 [Endocarpon pusillum Z07020]ERF69641.1 hypothetical protein EPUS_03633 [Endocarpon pusillum Z07020]